MNIIDEIIKQQWQQKLSPYYYYGAKDNAPATLPDWPKDYGIGSAPDGVLEPFYVPKQRPGEETGINFIYQLIKQMFG